MENQPISEINLLLIDWITFTTKCWSESDLKDAIGLSNVDWTLADYGRYGYKRMEVFNGVSVLSDGKTHTQSGEEIDMGVCIECSGQGCRALESYAHVDWLVFLAFLMAEENEIKITRIDLAYDDHTGILNKARLKADTDEHFYRSKFKTWELRYGSKGFSIYHGSKKSRAMIRIYDKAAERGLLDGTHWIRVELQLREENAPGVCQAYLDHRSLGAVFGGVLATYLVYCEESEDSNVSRWKTADYWKELIKDARRIHIAATPGVEYNIFRLESFLVNTAGGGLQTWIDIFGMDALPELLKRRKGKKLNPKHKALLDLYGYHDKEKENGK